MNKSIRVVLARGVLGAGLCLVAIGCGGEGLEDELGQSEYAASKYWLECGYQDWFGKWKCDTARNPSKGSNMKRSSGGIFYGDKRGVGYVEYTLKVPGNYRYDLRAKVTARNGKQDSFYVSGHGIKKRTWHVRPRSKRHEWKVVAKDVYMKKKSKAKFRLSVREPYTYISDIQLKYFCYGGRCP